MYEFTPFGNQIANFENFGNKLTVYDMCMFCSTKFSKSLDFVRATDFLKLERNHFGNFPIFSWKTKLKDSLVYLVTTERLGKATHDYNQALRRHRYRRAGCLDCLIMIFHRRLMKESIRASFIRGALQCYPSAALLKSILDHSVQGKQSFLCKPSHRYLELLTC